MDVQLRDTFVELPTQRLLKPSVNPALFGEGFNTFPYPPRSHVEEAISPVRWRAVEVENEYLKLVVLPELGGRVAQLYDKLAGRDVFLPLRQVRPDFAHSRHAHAPGGLAFSFPEACSPATEGPVNCLTRRYSDGSASVVLGGIEQLSFLHWSVELRLYPEQACLEESSEIRNTSDEFRNFCWWNGAAVPFAKGMRMACPFDWRTVPGGSVEKWPMDGFLDSSDPFSLPDGYETAARLVARDCFGAYYPDWDFGSAHCAPRKIVKGRGFFVHSGEYVELRSGPFESNGTILPHGGIHWKEYWFGVRGIGPFCQASSAVAVAVERNAGSAVVRFSPNSRFENATVLFTHDGQRLECPVSLLPECPSAVEFPGVGPEEKLTVDVLWQGRLLVSLGHEAEPSEELPDSGVTPAPCAQPCTEEPGEPLARAMLLESQGLVAQAEEAYDESLCAGGDSVDALLRLGRIRLARLSPSEAEDCFERALHVDCRSGTACFLLASALNRCGDVTRARRLFQDIPTGDPLFEASVLEVAALNISLGDPQGNISLLDGATNPWGRFLLAVSCRMLGLAREQEDSGDLEEFFLAESYLSDGADALSSFTENREDVLVCVALEYMRVGLVEDCVKLLSLVQEPGMKTALVRACCGALPLADALSLPIDGVFVNEPLLLEMLECCEDDTGKAQWLIGSFKYSVGRHEEALENWQTSYELHFRHTALLYCLSQAQYLDGDLTEAYRYLHEDASLHQSANAESLSLLCRVLRERGDIFERLELLPLLQETADQNAVVTEIASALTDGGLLEEAIELLENASVQYPEDGNAAALWSRAIGSLALKRARDGRFEQARSTASRMFHYPDGLSCVGQRDAGRAEHFHLLGQVFRLTGDLEKSREAFRQGAMEGGRQKVKENEEAMRWVRLCQDELRF